jgi:outer membrane protein OmpA-like peptidoglycan-associated protein
MSTRLAAPLVALSLILSAALCRAQTAQSGEFSVERFWPAPGPRNFFTVERARTDGQMAFSLGLFGHYGNVPFVLQTCVSATDCSSPGAQQIREINVIETLVTGDLLASLTVVPRLQFGLRVPYTYVKGLGVNTDLSDPGVGQSTRTGLSGSGLGDPMFEAKVRAVGMPSDTYVLGLSAFATAPVAHAVSSTKNRFIGDVSPEAGIRGIYAAEAGRFSFAANIAGVYRKQAIIGSTRPGSEMRYGAGAGFVVSPILNAMAEVFGATRFVSDGTNTLEGELGLELHPLSSFFSFTAGAGAGLVGGVGAPNFRAFAGIAFIHELTDADGDGIADQLDQCATVPEDKDGFQDADGCPDPDNDGDGIPDVNDKCPNEPETKNGYQDADGCPDELPDRDNDGISDAEDKCPDEGGHAIIVRFGDYYGCPDHDRDGIPDKIDKCPKEPEDFDGFQDADGCPDPDNDGDGIPDVDDQCINEPETKNGYQDADGCPDQVPDRDHDGISDLDDKCPDEPETYNGYQDDDGCPDGAPLAETASESIEIKRVINFAYNSDKIVGKPSFAVLDAVAAILTHHPEITRLEVGGHTDSTGDRMHNLDLSNRRAAAVQAYLVRKGVDAARLSSKGYGPDKPIVENKSAAARAKNRRVEFRILSATSSSPSPTSSPPPALVPPSTSTPRPAPTAPPP